MEVYGHTRVAGGASDASEQVKIMAFRDGLDLHVELVAYRNHARNSTSPANAPLPPASPAGSEHTSKLWEELVVSSMDVGGCSHHCYETQDADADSYPGNPRRDACNIVEPRFSAKCRSQHETWSEGEDDRDVSTIERRKCRWVGVGGNRVWASCLHLTLWRCVREHSSLISGV